MQNNNNNNAFDMGKAVKSEHVICAIVTGDKPLFFTKDGTFSNEIENIAISDKENLFEIVSQLPNWDEMAGGCAFLTGDEAQELFS